MNLSEMRSQVRVLLGETAQDGYLDSEIATQLNHGSLKVASELLCLHTHHDQATVAYSEPTLDPSDPRIEGRYSLPSDFLSLKDVQVREANIWYTVKKCSYDEFQDRARTISGGRPRFFRLEMGAVSTGGDAPGDVWLWPYPDSANYTLRIVHFQKPTRMVDDTDTCELPESAHLAVCYHAAMVLSRKWKDRALIQEMSALWAQELDMVKRLVNQFDQSGPIYVRNVY